MTILGMGIDYRTGRRLFPDVDDGVFARGVLQSVLEQGDRLRQAVETTTTAAGFRTEVERRVVDLGDPRSAGWSYLVNEGDPSYDAIVDAIRPLADHRGMADPAAPLLYAGETEDRWLEWLERNYSSLAGRRPPHYILIVGGPEQVPFGFQSLLESAASVGRVCFADAETLRVYVNKLLRLEQHAGPVIEREMVVFATDEGHPDPTYYSRKYMAGPLAQFVEREHGLHVYPLMGHEATKAGLQETLREHRPALVYTASHGIGAPDEPLALQKLVNGAICCQLPEDWSPASSLYSAADVPLAEPLLEGAVFFQFACFGYGTLAESDFHHWDPEVVRWNAEEDFVAALPMRLLAHPRGPIAFVGHVDTAWLHGFADPEQRDTADDYHRRLEPYQAAVDLLLRAEPVGRAMARMNQRFDSYNARIANLFDDVMRHGVPDAPGFQQGLVNDFITRNDAKNYMVFGDPAAHLRIPAG